MNVFVTELILCNILVKFVVPKPGNQFAVLDILVDFSCKSILIFTFQLVDGSIYGNVFSHCVIRHLVVVTCKSCNCNVVSFLLLAI